MPTRVIIDPRDPNNVDAIKCIPLNDVDEIHAYVPYLSNKKTTEGDPIEYVFTHNLMPVDKSDDKTADYLAVFSPNHRGDGVNGSVFDINCMWKIEGEQYECNTKSNITKQRVIKIADLTTNYASNQKLICNYQAEQEIGQWTPQMGLKYPPTIHQHSVSLLLRKQHGETLDKLIDKLHQNPTLLSVTDRLQITINLLQQFHTQISGVKLPCNRAVKPHIIHQDIKPANIIYNGKRIPGLQHKNPINYIDYGYAIPSNRDVRHLGVSGTPNWMDPYRYITQGEDRPSKISDLGSLARVIADLWGDMSRYNKVNNAEFEFNLEENITSNLCEQISELSENERNKLVKTIRTMTNFEMEDRLKHEEALATFKNILSERIAFLKMKANGRLGLLSPDLLMEMLKSPMCPQLIKRFKSEPQHLPSLLEKIKPRLAQLDAQTIRDLKTNGFDFSKQVITLADINTNDYSPELIALLIESGATLEPNLLEAWFYHNRRDDKLRWATICRVLYQLTPNPEQVITPAKADNSFESEFHTRYLTKSHTANDEETNVRLLKRHLKVVEEEKTHCEAIARKVNPIAKTALGRAILASRLSTPSVELTLAPRSHFKTLETVIDNFCILVLRAKAIRPIPGKQNRNQALQRVVDDLVKRQELSGYANWQAALDNLAPLKATLEKIEQQDANRAKETFRNRFLKPAPEKKEITPEPAVAKAPT